MDGVASPGTINEYSRGDHRHPNDVTKADASELLSVSQDVDGLKDAFEQYKIDTDSEIDQLDTRIASNTANISNLGTRVSGAESNIVTLQNRASNIEGDIVEINSNYSTLNTSFNQYRTSNDARVTTLETTSTNLVSRVGAVENQASTNTQRITVAEQNILNHNTRIATNEANITNLQSGQSSTSADLTALTSRVSVNEGNIATNSSDIQSILDRLGNDEYFRGLFATTAEIIALENPVSGNFAYNEETGTIWSYTGTTWADTGTEIPNQAIPPSDSLPLVDGKASAGTSTEYSRGDHRHPTDTTCASASDLSDLTGRVDNIESNITELRTDVDQNTTDIDGIELRVTNAESNISINTGNISTLQTTVSDLGEHVGNLEDDVTNINADVANLNDDVTTLQTSVSDHSGRITTLEGNVTDLQAVQGNYVTLTGSQSIGGVKTFNSTINATAITPVSNATYDIGTLSNRFNLGAFNQISANTITPNQSAGSRLGSSTIPYENGYFTNIQKGGVDVATVNDIPNTNNFVTTNTVQSISGNKTFSSLLTTVNLQPMQSQYYSLGGSASRWLNIYTVNVGADDTRANGYFTNELYRGGVRVATVDEIPTAKTVQRVGVSGAASITIPAGAEVINVNYNHLNAFDDEYTVSGTTLTLNASLYSTLESTDRLQVTYLI